MGPLLCLACNAASAEASRARYVRLRVPIVPFIAAFECNSMTSMDPATCVTTGRRSLDCGSSRLPQRRRSFTLQRDCRARCSWQQPPPDHQDQHGPQLPVRSLDLACGCCSTPASLKELVFQAKPRHARSIQAAVAQRASTVFDQLMARLTPQARVRQAWQVLLTWPL